MVCTSLRSASLASRGYTDERSDDIWSERPSKKSVGSYQTTGKRVDGVVETRWTYKMVVQSVLQIGEPLGWYGPCRQTELT